MTRIGALGENEWTLMKICWQKGFACGKEIYDEIVKEKKLQYTTVKTSLDRLANKGFLKRVKHGSIWFYTPLLSEEQVKTNAIKEFAHTVFGNKIAPIFLHFIKDEKYSEEIDELRSAINDIDEEE